MTLYYSTLQYINFFHNIKMFHSVVCQYFLCLLFQPFYMHMMQKRCFLYIPHTIDLPPVSTSIYVRNQLVQNHSNQRNKLSKRRQVSLFHVTVTDHVGWPFPPHHMAQPGV